MASSSPKLHDEWPRALLDAPCVSGKTASGCHSSCSGRGGCRRCRACRTPVRAAVARSGRSPRDDPPEGRGGGEEQAAFDPSRQGSARAVRGLGLELPAADAYAPNAGPSMPPLGLLVPFVDFYAKTHPACEVYCAWLLSVCDCASNDVRHGSNERGPIFYLFEAIVGRGWLLPVKSALPAPE